MTGVATGVPHPEEGRQTLVTVIGEGKRGGSHQSLSEDLSLVHIPSVISSLSIFDVSSSNSSAIPIRPWPALEITRMPPKGV